MKAKVEENQTIQGWHQQRQQLLTDSMPVSDALTALVSAAVIGLTYRQLNAQMKKQA